MGAQYGVDNFYPRSPCGERPLQQRVEAAQQISIHALLAESDDEYHAHRTNQMYFYPRSPCGERHRQLKNLYLGRHFYPRSPCGERQFNGKA